MPWDSTEFYVCGDPLRYFVTRPPEHWTQVLPRAERPGVYVARTLEEYQTLVREAGPGASAPDPRLLRLLLSKGKRGHAVDWAQVGSPALRLGAMPHQIKAVNRIVEDLGGRALVALPTGTGKSLVSCAAAAHYGGTVLVACVASAQAQWVEELARWTEFPRASVINGAKGELATVCVCTYDSVGSREDVRARAWTTVIVDESHKLGGNCARNDAIMRTCARARCALALSATPMKGRPRDVFNTLRCLLPDLFTNRRTYERRYCDGKEGRFGWEAKGATHDAELETLISYLSATCSKAEALPDLPPISFSEVTIKMSDSALNEFKAMQAEYDELTKRAERETSPDRLKALELARGAVSTRMYVRTGELKVAPCVRWLLEELLPQHPDPREKVLVFCHHARVIDETCEALKAAGVGYARVDGGVPAGRRHEILRAMRDPQDTSDTRVAVLSLETCAASLNLVGANLVVMFQMSFTPADNDQAYARAWRKGATRPVHVFKLLSPGTHDDVMQRIHRTKVGYATRILKKMREGT